MTKKNKLIEEFSELDAKEAREALLIIARDPDTKAKDKVEAWKLLMRMHKRLQVDKQVIKGGEKKKTDKPQISLRHQQALDEILKKNV